MNDCKKYYFSYFGLSLNTIELLSIALIVILSLLVSRFNISRNYIIPIIIINISIPFIISALFSRKVTIFEKNNDLIKKFNINIFAIRYEFAPVGNIPYCYLLIYEKGIEIRVLLNCYFIPFNTITELRIRTKVSPQIIIVHDINCEKVPNTIALDGIHRDAINLIKKNVSKNITIS